jgi:hypothetical protein
MINPASAATTNLASAATINRVSVATINRVNAAKATTRIVIVGTSVAHSSVQADQIPGDVGMRAHVQSNDGHKIRRLQEEINQANRTLPTKCVAGFPLF